MSVEKLEKNEGRFSLVIIDELCSGTNVNEGSDISLSICKYLSENSNNISLITTHLNTLSTLEDNYNYKNYKMKIEIKEDDEINYTYKLESGISKDRLAVHVLKRLNMKNEIVRQIN